MDGYEYKLASGDDNFGVFYARVRNLAGHLHSSLFLVLQKKTVEWILRKSAEGTFVVTG
jgi:hypothetical protein